jgi:hypothetical protein
MSGIGGLDDVANGKVERKEEEKANERLRRTNIDCGSGFQKKTYTPPADLIQAFAHAALWIEQ